MSVNLFVGEDLEGTYRDVRTAMAVFAQLTPMFKRLYVTGLNEEGQAVCYAFFNSEGDPLLTGAPL